MKTNLLFTAALMSALSTVPSDMYAFQFRGNEFSARDYVSVLAEDVKERPKDNTDVSDWIVNPDFNNNNGDGWENGSILGFSGLAEPCGTAEVYNREFQISQLIENIPNGLYTVTVQGWANADNHAYLNGNTAAGNSSSVIGGGISGSLQAVSKIFNENSEEHKVVLGNLMVVDGKIRIGVSWNEYWKNSWVAFDNFKLIYNNDGKDRISGLYNDLKNTLQTLNDSQYPEALNVYINKEAGLIDSEDNTDSYCLAYMKLKNLEVLLSSEAKDLKKLQDECQKLIDESAGDVSSLQDALDRSNESLSTVKDNDEIISIYGELKISYNEYLVSIGRPYVVEYYDFNDGTYKGWNTSVKDKWPGPEHGVLEFFNTNFDFWRPLSVLYKGWYQIEVNAFYRSTDYASYLDKKNKTLAVVFGDNGGPDKRYSMPALCLYDQDCSDVEGIKMGSEGKFPNLRNEANACFSAGKYKMVVNVYVGDNKTLNYGLAGTNQGNSWMCFDNFKVTYIGSDLAKMYDAMKSDAIALAEKYGLTAYKAEIENMAPQDTENVTENDVWTLNEKTKKIIDIVNKIVDVKLGNNEFANRVKTKKDEILANSTAPQNSIDKFNEAFELANNADGIYEKVTSVNGVDYIFNEYFNEADPVGDYTFDMNHLLTNPNVRFWKGGSPATGWYCDLDRGNFQVQSNDKQEGEDVGYEFVEAWTGGVFHQKDGNGWLIYQSVDLSAGAYSLSAYTFGQDPGNNDAQSTDTPSANLSVGYGSTVLAQGEPVEKGTKKLQTFSFMVNEPLTGDKKGKLGIFINEDNDCSWFGINDMKLVKVAPTTLSLSEENTSLGIDSDTYGNVTVDRTLKADSWNTFCVPFSMTAEQLAANKITEVRKLENTVENGGSVVLNFSDPVTEIEAGVPYIVKVSDAVSQITVNGVAVKVAEPAPLEVGSVNMQGNYGKMSITGDQYFISDNKFYRAADKNVTVKGFRAYITLDEVMVGVNQMLINIDGNVTAIEDVLGEDVDTTVNVYTIDGVCVKSGVKSSEALDGLRKGIYIVNGKKVVK